MGKLRTSMVGLGRSCVAAGMLLVAGCAAGDNASLGPRATKEERDRSADAYAACLSANGATQDDRKADIATAAAALQNACRTEFQASLDAFARGRLQPADRQAFFDSMQATGLAAATRVISQLRAVPAGAAVPKS
ncbi:hypothetical protein BH11PSE3_BH11PSE3_14170 [soil metagenome]